MIVITYQPENDWSMSIIKCSGYKTRPVTDEEGMMDIVYHGAKTIISHNAGFGMSGRIGISYDWEDYVREDVEIKKYENEMEGKRAFFKLLIDEGYGGDERNFLNDFFNDYAGNAGGKLDLLEWILV